MLLKYLMGNGIAVLDFTIEQEVRQALY